jgi:hypothetical protein
MEPGEQSQKNQGETMGPTSKRFLKVRIPEGGDPGEWELFAPDGAPIEGWYQLSVGRDHSGRYALHVTFDQFECVNADGRPVEVQLTCPTAKPHEKLPPLPPAGMHRHPHEGTR